MDVEATLPSEKAVRGFLPPPLYQGVNNSCVAARASPVTLVGEKQSSRTSFQRSSQASFKPVLSPEESFLNLSFRSFTPPTSPYYKKAVASSPSCFTTASDATETTVSESFCLSPSPTFGSQRGTPYDSLASTPVNYSKSTGAEYLTPTRKSPTKRIKSPYPDDTGRKQRVKTELCMHYLRGNPCPFGSGCTYAHGEDELQMTKLMDLHRAGLIEDVDTYRTKPCLTWVMTGSW